MNHWQKYVQQVRYRPSNLAETLERTDWVWSSTYVVNGNPGGRNPIHCLMHDHMVVQ